MITDDDLDLVETDELVAALQRRFEVSLFIGQKSMDDDTEHRYFNWRGHYLHAIGLLQVMLHRVTARAASGLRDSGGEEDEEEDEEESEGEC